MYVPLLQSHLQHVCDILLIFFGIILKHTNISNNLKMCLHSSKMSNSEKVTIIFCSHLLSELYT